jgi:hypothetical protein
MGTVVPRITVVTVSRMTFAVVVRGGLGRLTPTSSMWSTSTKACRVPKEICRGRHPVSCPGELPDIGLA